VELRLAEQRERRVVGGDYQQCGGAGNSAGLWVCEGGAVGGCWGCLSGGGWLGEFILFSYLLFLQGCV
jgi:hypothetical protein